MQIGSEDMNITFEDQQMINTFARKNAKLTEIKDEIEEKKVRCDISGLQKWTICSSGDCVNTLL